MDKNYNSIIKSVSSRLYEDILELIINNKVEAGQKLIIDEIAQKYSVSNIPVREALNKLKLDGLLVKEPYKSYRVKNYSLSELEDIYEARIAIESYASKLGAKAELSERKEVAKYHKNFVNNLENNNINKEFKYINMTFHSKIINLANNSFLNKMYEYIEKQILFLTSQVFENKTRPHKSIKEHSEIVKYLLEGNSKMVGLAMTEHIYESLKTHKQIYSKKDFF